MDVLFELANALSTEGVRNGLAFSGVFGAVARVEEATLDGNKGIVVVARTVLAAAFADECHDCTNDFRNPVPWPYTMGIASGSAIETWFGWILTSLPCFSCSCVTVRYLLQRLAS